MIVFTFTVYIGGNCNPEKTQKEDYRLTLTKNIDYELNEKEFHSRSKDGADGIFSRQRKLTIRVLIVLIMSLNRAIQRELDSFFQKVNSSDFTIREATKGAFKKATFCNFV